MFELFNGMGHTFIFSIPIPLVILVFSKDFVSNNMKKPFQKMKCAINDKIIKKNFSFDASIQFLQNVLENC
jgi:hypothetical protein